MTLGPNAHESPRGRSTCSISVVVPVYNEIELVTSSTRTLSAFLVARALDHEIIIVESGSTDGSPDACDKLAAELNHVAVIHESRRNGMGAALRLGYAAAAKDLIWLVTPDMPFPLTALDEALPLIDDCDCVLSYRSNDDRSFGRRVPSWGYNFLVKAMLGLPMRNVNSAFKLYRRWVLAEMELISNGWFLDAEVLYWVARRGLRYREIGVPLCDREAGESKVGPLDLLRTLLELRDFKRTMLRAKRAQSRVRT